MFLLVKKRLNRVVFRAVVLVMLLSISSCAANKPRKIPKRGPIPCPVKDC